MTARVVVVGLGPGDPGLVTATTLAEIARVPRRFLRTARHPSAALVPDATTFDDRYERAYTFEEVYGGIVAALVAAAAEAGEVLYAVPGSPLVAERTVELLRAEAGVEVVVHPALSFAELAWSVLGVDPLAAGARVVDGRRFATEAAGSRGPLLVGQVDDRHVLSDVKLAVDVPPARPVTVLQRLGLPDQVVTEVAWDDLDRVVAPDHLTALWIPELAAPVAAELVRLDELARTLRRSCPWDREQTHASLRRHLLSEVHEVLEAIDALDAAGTETDGAEGDEALEEELGDLLFQVALHAAIAAEGGRFTLADVARGVHDKLVARHPHVFGDARAETAADVMEGWEQRKLAEKGRRSVMEGIPAGLPALALAEDVQRKASGLGLTPAELVPAALLPAAFRGATAADVDPEAEVGERLFAAVEAARARGVDAESALRVAAGRARRRVSALEELAVARGVDLRALDADARAALLAEVEEA